MALLSQITVSTFIRSVSYYNYYDTNFGMIIIYVWMIQKAMKLTLLFLLKLLIIIITSLIIIITSLIIIISSFIIIITS